MSRVAAITLALVLGAGCRDPELAQLKQLRDEVCACKTASCGEEALKRVPKHDGDTAPRPITADHRSQELARAMMDCMAKLYVADRPSTDPDAEAK